MSSRFVIIVGLIIIVCILISWVFSIYYHDIMIALFGLLCGTVMMLSLIVFDGYENKNKKK